MKLIGCFFILLVIAGCLIAAAIVYDKQGDGVAVAMPTPTPTLGPSVPLEAFEFALDAQRDVAIESYKTILGVEFAHAGVEVSRNISWWIVVIICGVIILALLAKG